MRRDLQHIMTYWEALLYGAVQGVAEYLPISSSAHLILLPRFLGGESYGLSFDVFLHLGTLFATLIYFWKDWLGILATVPGLERFIPARKILADRETPWSGVVDWKLIVVATIPALIAGALFHDIIATVLRGNAVVVTTLIIGGIALFGVDRFCPQRKTLKKATMKDALLIGLFQCLALIPGVSRAGSTMTGGRALGFERGAAARFSFLISAPITAAAVVFELRNWRELLEEGIGLGPLLAAGLGSFVFGILAIGGLLRILRHFSFLTFAIYRVVLAFVVLSVLGV